MAPPLETSYHRILRPLLFQLDPERAHRLTLAMMGPLAMLRKPAPDPPALATAPWGIRFSNPIFARSPDGRPWGSASPSWVR
jgi:hypothetical protein